MTPGLPGWRHREHLNAGCSKSGSLLLFSGGLEIGGGTTPTGTLSPGFTGEGALLQYHYRPPFPNIARFVRQDLTGKYSNASRGGALPICGMRQPTEDLCLPFPDALKNRSCIRHQCSARERASRTEAPRSAAGARLSRPDRNRTIFRRSRQTARRAISAPA